MISQTENKLKSSKVLLLLYSVVILVVSYFIYFRDYHLPPDRVWDEHFTVGAAYRYINGRATNEFHPPLGYFLFAAGEVLLNPNETVDTGGVGSTYYQDEFPEGFSFRGVRFFPALMGALSPLLFFILLYSIVPNAHYAGIFSGFYLFDNALVLQSRTANFDSPQIFFMLLALVLFTRIINSKRPSPLYYALMGLMIGASVMVRVNSAVLLALLAFAGAACFRRTRSLKKTAVVSAVSGMSFLLVVITLTLINNSMLEDPEAFHPSRVHSLNVLNLGLLVQVMPDHGYASHPLSWPVGHRSICYKWETDSEGGKFLYFQGNPAVWKVGLAGIVLGMALILSRIFFCGEPRPGPYFNMILVYVVLYALYIGSLLMVDRAQFLTYYLIPLVFSFATAYLVFFRLFQESVKNRSSLVLISALIYLVQVIAVFIFFSPLTYYRKLGYREFRRRAWVNAWELNYDIHE